MTTIMSPYDIDPCPECGEMVNEIKMDSDYAAPSYYYLSSSPVPQMVYPEPRVTVGPCGHQVKCEYYKKPPTDAISIEQYRVILTSLFPPDSPFAKFRDLATSCAKQLGWKVWLFPQYGYSVEVKIRCNHGGDAQQMVSMQLIEQAMSLEQVAHVMFSDWRKQCEQTHNSPYYIEPEKYIVGSYKPYPPPMHYSKSPGNYISPSEYAYAGSIGSYGSHPVVDALAQIVPAIRTATAECPECHSAHQPLALVIVHLNDQHKWPREKIADWLDLLDIDLTIQPKESHAIDRPSQEKARYLEKAALDIYGAYGLISNKPVDIASILGTGSATS